MVAPCAAGVLKLDIGGTQMCSIILSTSFGASAGQRWEASEKADAELIEFWSGRPGSNPRRPAWENGQCLVFSNINAHGVDSRYGKRQQNRGSFRLVR